MDRCAGTLGQGYVEKLQPLHDLNKIEKLGHQTAEFKYILDSNESFPGNNYLDVSEQLKKARIEGNFLDAEEFAQMKASMTTIFKCVKFLKDRQADYPLLHEASQSVQLDKSLLNAIDAIIDDRGEIRDNASPELKAIRQEIVYNQTRARRTLESILRRASKEGLVGEDVNLTIRSGRLVIPVLAEHKRQIKGFIHGESATGQTVYLEPTEVLDINNEVRDLEYQERREIIRLLTNLTDRVREQTPYLEKAYRFLGMVDFIRAKAKLAQELEAIWPAGKKTPHIQWVNARHPLLFHSYQKSGKKVVPLTIKLDESERLLLISGPNAGGKSVCLKTVALVQYMYQCGMMVPVGEGSTFGLFQNFFIDIGDQQSLENDLSTYSSHLTNMRYFLENINGKSLLLIDEFGTGTEPQFGGAIAESILQTFVQKHSYGVITTHYANLKKLAEKATGLVNGAMKFDPYKLEPLYELEMGKPGSSFALEIAGKIGLPQELLNRAKKLVGHSHVKFDQLVSELETDKANLTKKLKEVEDKTASLEQSVKDYNDLKEYLDTEKKKILKAAKEEAARLVAQANKSIESTIRQIKENQAEKEATRKAREELKQFEASVKEPEKPAKKTKPTITLADGPIQVGDRVRIKDQEAIGEVTGIKGKKVELVIGTLKSTIALDKLEKINGGESRPPKASRKSSGYNVSSKAAEFSTNLDIRGKRAEEAITEVEYFLDQAILLGHKELRIVHGKGYGILRDLIRQQMRDHAKVERMQDEHIERGGSGVTLVTLK